jgi:hypothetical protein
VKHNKLWLIAVALSAGLITIPHIGLADGIPQQIAALQAEVATLQGQVATLQSQVATLQANGALVLAPYVSVVNGLAGPHIIFNGANIHIQDGLGTTDDNTTTILGGTGTGTLTELGTWSLGMTRTPSASPKSARTT